MSGKGVLALVPVRGAAGPAEAPPVSSLTALAGRPLLWYSLAAAREAPSVDRVAVVTADPAAAACAAGEGAEVIALPPALTAADAPAEAVVVHALDALAKKGYRPALVVLLAPQTPLRRAGRLEEALAIVARDRADSLLSVSAEPPLLWRPSPGGLVPFYDPRQRPPRHGATPDWLHENGSLYVSRAAGLRRAGSRLFGKISILQMGTDESARADDAAGLAVCGALLAHVRPEWAQRGAPAPAELSARIS